MAIRKGGLMEFAVLSKNVSFTYDTMPQPSLNQLNLAIQPGECVLICGESGSGKSTLARLVNGISPEYVNGQLTGDFKTKELISGETALYEYTPIVGSVFQNPRNQHFTTNTTSELVFPLENCGKTREDMKKRLNVIRRNFSIDHLLDRNIYQLSDGQRQFIAFISAMMLNPDIYVLDEVTSNLDDIAVDVIRQTINQLKKQGKTILIFEHRLAWIVDLVDRVLYLKQGYMQKIWNQSEFMALSDDQLHELGLRSQTLVTYQSMVEDKIKTHQHDLEDSNTIQIHNLAIGYHKKIIKDELSMTLYPGEITTLLGPNGVGKTTLAQTLIGLQPSLAGEIYWGGHKQSERQLLERGFLVMQDVNYQLFTESVEAEITLNAKKGQQMDQVLESLALSDLRDRHPHSLSEGQKQRVAIAAGLVSGKDLLIFDEPTSGLDYKNMMAFGKLLNQIKQRGVHILVITHDQELAALWSDRIYRIA